MADPRVQAVRDGEGAFVADIAVTVTPNVVR